MYGIVTEVSMTSSEDGNTSENAVLHVFVTPNDKLLCHPVLAYTCYRYSTTRNYSLSILAMKFQWIGVISTVILLDISTKKWILWYGSNQQRTPSATVELSLPSTQ